MAKKALIIKAAAKPKFAVRAYTRCQRCGRPKAVYRKFGVPVALSTDDDLLEIEGRRDQLVGKIQTRYGITHDQAEAQVSTWEQKRSRDM